MEWAFLSGLSLPWWVTGIVLLLVLVSKLADRHEGVRKLLAPLSSRHRRNQVIADYEHDRSSQNVVIADLKGQLDYLTGRIDELVLQSQCRDEYIIYDQEWHRENDLVNAAVGRSSAPHVPFTAFRRSWMVAHGK